jgi:hypothetical protein
VILDSSYKEKFIKKLSFLLPPFDRFVAKLELPEQEPIFPSREKYVKRIAEIIDHKGSMLIPVVSEVGGGKTHFLWGIYNSFDIDANTAFLSFPRSKEKFLYYLYSNFIKQFGQNNLRDFSQNFGDKFGAAEKLYGLFRTQNIERIAKSAFDQLEDGYDPDSLEQCINVIVQHLMNNDKSQIAERWLLGQLMDEDDLRLIRTRGDLSEEIMAKTMLKLIVENHSQDIVLLFDDLDKAAKEFDNLNEYSGDSDDVNWAGDLNTDVEEGHSNPGDFALLEELFELMKDIKNLKIIITMEQGESQRYIDWFKAKKGKSSVYIADPLELGPITLKDAYNLYFSRLKNFCIKYHVTHPVSERTFKIDGDFKEYEGIYGEDLYFPLNQEILEVVYGIKFGNPREILRNFKCIFDALIFEEVDIENIQTEYKRFLRK